MKIGVPAEGAAGETRVAVSPDTIKAYVKKGLEVAVEAGAGKGSFISDDQYAAAGARVVKSAAEAVKDADIVLTVRRPSDAAVKALKKGALVIGQLDPYGDRKAFDALAKAGASAFAMELMPRITRAQSMDVLSSQANLAGYKAVVDGGRSMSRASPPDDDDRRRHRAGRRVFIMGVGVAGLQAIATASAASAPSCPPPTCAPATKEQVQSSAPSSWPSRTTSSSRRETAPVATPRSMSPDVQKKQAELVADAHQPRRTSLITTALIPGRPCPDPRDGRTWSKVHEAGLGHRRSGRRARRQPAPVPKVPGEIVDAQRRHDRAAT